ncbi:hypothetical protein KUCAC02_037153, partial [Chaenocephalus aceratus]
MSKIKHEKCPKGNAGVADRERESLPPPAGARADSHPETRPHVFLLVSSEVRLRCLLRSEALLSCSVPRVFTPVQGRQHEALQSAYQ